MRSVPRGVLLLAALALPIAAVLVSFALTGGTRAPEIPETVRVGSTPGSGHQEPGSDVPLPVVPGPSEAPAPPDVHAPPPPAELPPPAPHDDDADDADDHDD
ncbi:hypothetical protein QFW96_29150 [Saccharopolyspora sp. TS4A08]|uniref:Small hydrophilic protein n=1 Tax=Saccharopolyspora ipomoeae TaxID=3042027 RepID=A0ABT6PXH3_9PSEU|nr:hypothetical protein [Saccharopolyspora sp. TS4A08]MDI2032719.1 hypothetical protein [Saccharopolyspora sp. TS4A08]